MICIFISCCWFLMDLFTVFMGPILNPRGFVAAPATPNQGGCRQRWQTHQIDSRRQGAKKIAQGLEPCCHVGNIVGLSFLALQQKSTNLKEIWSLVFFPLFSLPTQGWCNLGWYMWKLLNYPGQHNILIVDNIGSRIIIHVVSWDHLFFFLKLAIALWTAKINKNR